MKGWFSYFEILEIYQLVKREEYQQDPITRTEKLNTETKNPDRIEKQKKKMKIETWHIPTS